jgi:hypothetical protein
MTATTLRTCTLAALTLTAVAAGAADPDPGAALESWYRSEFAPPFLERKVDPRKAAAHYRATFSYLDIGGETVVTDAAAFIADYVRYMNDNDWRSSELLDVEARMLNGHSAMLLAEWKLGNGAGRNIGDCPTNRYFYVLERGSGRWEIVLEGALSCDSVFALR